MDDFEPGDLGNLYDTPPPRKRRRRARWRESELDDAWAAADEDDAYDDALELEDLAAGYVWEDRDRLGVEPDPLDGQPDERPAGLGPLPVSPRRGHPRRRVVSPTRASRPQPDREPVPVPGPVPWWGIVLLVTLAIGAVIAIGLACVFALSVM